MTSYRFSYMKMKGLGSSNDKVTTEDALSSYMMVPTAMSMKMHMIGVMYGINDRLTIAKMGSFVEKEVDIVNAMNVEFKRRTADIGDSKVNFSYSLINTKNNRLQFNLAFSLPTGNINKKHSSSRLPYSMQIGSGSYELLPGFSYSGYQENYSYGTQINGKFALNSNDNGYKFGNNYNITGWVSRKINNFFSVSSRFDYNKYEAIEGKDDMLNQMMIPTSNISLYNKEKLDILFGVNLFMAHGRLASNRFAIEFSIPIYQKIDGPMLQDDYTIIIGWQNSF